MNSETETSELILSPKTEIHPLERLDEHATDHMDSSSPPSSVVESDAILEFTTEEEAAFLLMLPDLVSVSTTTTTDPDGEDSEVSSLSSDGSNLFETPSGPRSIFQSYWRGNKNSSTTTMTTSSDRATAGDIASIDKTNDPDGIGDHDRSMKHNGKTVRPQHDGPTERSSAALTTSVWQTTRPARSFQQQIQRGFDQNDNEDDDDNDSTPACGFFLFGLFGKTRKKKNAFASYGTRAFPVRTERGFRMNPPLTQTRKSTSDSYLQCQKLPSCLRGPATSSSPLKAGQGGRSVTFHQSVDVLRYEEPMENFADKDWSKFFA